jgi:hypothetical protein
MSALSEALRLLRGHCKSVKGSLTLSPREMERLEELFRELEIAAVRLEAVEATARAKLAADRALAELGAYPTTFLDLDALRRGIAAGKVAVFPTARRLLAEGFGS